MCDVKLRILCFLESEQDREKTAKRLDTVGIGSRKGLRLNLRYWDS